MGRNTVSHTAALRFDTAASPPATLRTFPWLAAIGGSQLLPSLQPLFRVFATTAKPA